jgi:hypothetical protein
VNSVQKVLPVGQRATSPSFESARPLPAAGTPSARVARAIPHAPEPLPAAPNRVVSPADPLSSAARLFPGSARVPAEGRPSDSQARQPD